MGSNRSANWPLKISTSLPLLRFTYSTTTRWMFDKPIHRDKILIWPAFFISWPWIYTRAQKLAHISYGLLHKHPWRWEVCAWQVWTKMFQRWGPFLKNMYLTLCQFSKKNLIRYVLWKVSNFALIFYVIRTLHKKSRQSLRPSTEGIGWDFFRKLA